MYVHNFTYTLYSSFTAGALDDIDNLVQLVKLYGGEERGVF